MTKLDKDYADYSGATRTGDRCDECRWFKPPNACEIVAGNIGPGMWCRFHHRKAGKRVNPENDRAYVKRMRSEEIS